jgi:3-hydroxyacyl-CoA dehydrogenase
MKLKQKIGIIGKGFVGSAVQFGFSPNVGIDAEVRVYDVNTIKGAWKTNLQVRPEKDWEQLKGRAVVDE